LEKLNALSQSIGGSGPDSISGFNENRQSHMQIQNWTSSFLSNVIVMIGLAAFAFVVKYVFNE